MTWKSKLSRLISSRLVSISLKSKLTVVSLSLLAGVFLMLVLPFFPSGKTHHLDIVATGESNPESLGREVHFVILYRGDNNKKIDLEGFKRDGSWKKNSGELVTSDKSAALRWKGEFDKDLKLFLILRATAWSGRAQVVWDGKPQFIDLYAEMGSGGPITIPLLAKAGYGWNRGVRLIANILVLGFIVLIAVFLCTAWAFSDDVPVSVNRWSWTGYFVVCVIAYAAYLYAFWPGLMTPDSYDQWEEAMSLQLTNRNPFFHTLHVWLLTRIWESPAVISLVQVFSISALISWGCILMRRQGIPKSVIWVACILCALSPFNGFLVITLWKDVFYCMAFFAFTLILIKIVFSEGDWLRCWYSPAVLGGVAVLVALYRHNGPPAAFGTLFLLLFVYLKYWRKTLLALAISLSIWLLVLGPLASALVVPLKEHKRHVSSILLSKIAPHINADTQMTQEEKEFLSQIPFFIEACRSDLYSDTTYQPINRYIHRRTGKWSMDFPVCEETAKFVRLFASLSMRNPLVTIKSHLYGSSWVWRVYEDYSRLDYWGPIAALKRSALIVSLLDKDKNDEKRVIRTDSMRSRLKEFFIGLKRKLYKSNVFRMIALKSSLYMYLFLFSVVICALRRKSWKVLMVYVPTALHTLTIIALVRHTGFRYQWPVYLVGLFLFLPLLFVPKRVK